MTHREGGEDAQGTGVHKEHNSNTLVPAGTGPTFDAGRGGEGQTLE